MKLSQRVSFLWMDLPSAYRMDRNVNGGGIALYVREDVSSKQISFKNDDKDIEDVLLKFNLRKRK